VLVKDFIESLVKEGKSEEEIVKAVAEKYKPAAPPENPNPPEKPEPKPNESLNEKVDRERRERETKDQSSKKVEAALRFDIASDKFIEDHKSILPKNIAEIFAAAKKENYDSVIDKVNATKSAVLQSFFSVESNLELATPRQKSQIEDYLKLTKKAREDQAEQLWENIFEPVLEMQKRLKKAEEVNRANSGYNTGSDAHNTYVKKLEDGARRKYLGEKI
jgi:hypothetical protein